MHLDFVDLLQDDTERDNSVHTRSSDTENFSRIWFRSISTIMRSTILFIRELDEVLEPAFQRISRIGMQPSGFSSASAKASDNV